VAYPLIYLCYSRIHTPYVKKYNRVQNIIDLYYFDSKRRSSYVMFLNDKSAASTQVFLRTGTEIRVPVSFSVAQIRAVEMEIYKYRGCIHKAYRQ
jgi:hypothetical protein